MSRFLHLVAGETKKIWRQKAAVVLLIIFLALNAILAALLIFSDVDMKSAILEGFGSDFSLQTHAQKYSEENEQMPYYITYDEHGNIQYNYYTDYYRPQPISAEERINSYKEQLNDPEISNIEKNFIMMQIDSLEKSAAIDNYISENNVSFKEDVSNSAYYLQFSMSVMCTIAIIGTLIIGAGTVAGEASDGTMKLLLTRPFKRWKILTSKFVAALLYGLFMYVLGFIFSFVIGGLLFGFDGFGLNIIASFGKGSAFSIGIIPYTLLKFALSFTQIIMLLSMVFLISCLFKSRALAVGISMLIYFVGSGIVKLLAILGIDILKYVIFFNMDLSPFLTALPSYPGMTILQSAITAAVHFVVFMAASYALFIKRDVN